jgi:hypothetical protein
VPWLSFVRFNNRRARSLFRKGVKLPSHHSARYLRIWFMVITGGLLMLSASGCESLAVTPVRPIVNADAAATPDRPTVTPLLDPTLAPTSTPIDTPTPAPTSTDTPPPADAGGDFTARQE